MSEEQLKAFLGKVKGDTNLQERLKAAADSDAVVSIAKEVGFSISIGDIKAQQSELSDEDLERVTGGVKGDLGILETQEQHMMCDTGTLNSPCG